MAAGYGAPSFLPFSRSRAGHKGQRQGHAGQGRVSGKKFLAALGKNFLRTLAPVAAFVMPKKARPGERQNAASGLSLGGRENGF